MLEIRTRIAPIRLELEDLPSVLSRLAQDGWEPAVLQSEKYFMQLAGVDGKMSLPVIRRRVSPYGGRYTSVVGDVFFRNSDVYYLVNDPGEFALDDVGARFRLRGADRKDPNLEIGVISIRTRRSRGSARHIRFRC